ncbi:MAG TPA: right-handed parallel beta-helix repeat-containing protein [bacterium]|nr:right-handed parallel beta-helix repeat-containing protein [bacterium]
MPRSLGPRTVRIALSMILTVGLALPGKAAQHTVRPDGLGDFPTIQDAVNASLSGDEILLENGRFTGPGNRDITFDTKDLVLRSVNGAPACTLDSQGAAGNPHRAIFISGGQSPATRIDGLTIVGGYTSGTFPQVGGAGILITTSSHPTIVNCIFDGNVSGFQGFGAGLLAFDNCDVRIADCIFRNGDSGWYGGGFTLRLNSDGIVDRCLVIGNHSIHAGGGASITNSNALVTDCIFVNNVTDEVDGGGVLVKAGARPTFTRCVFAGNLASYGGGIGLGNLPEVTLVDCLFEGNHARVLGGAIDLDQEPSVLHLQNCTVVNNTAPGIALQVYIGEQATFTMHNSILWGDCGSGFQAYCFPTGTFEGDCNLIQGGQAEIAGNGTILYGPNNRDLDPLFCGPKDCGSIAYPIGDWTVDALSPAAPPGGGCGAIGAYPVGCGSTSVHWNVESSTWGQLKNRYR